MNSLFLVVLGLSLLVDLALGAWAGANFSHFANTWGLGGVAPASAAPNGVAPFLGWVLATCLVGFAAIQGIAFHWTRRNKDEGPQLAIVFGCWLVLSSLATFAFASAQGSSWITSLAWKFLGVDGLRGVVLAVLGFLALRAPSVVRELRLPDGARQPRHREERHERPRSGHSRQDHRDDRPRRRDEGREDRGRSGGGRGGRGRDERQPHSVGGHGPHRGDAPHRGHAEERHEEAHRGAQPPRAGRDPRGARQSPLKGGTGIAPDLESRAVAEARRILPDTAERPLKVVVRGAPERFRALAPDDSRMADPFPVLPPAVPPSGGVPSVGAGEAIVAEEGGGRRRRRRRPRGGAGSAEPRFEEGLSSSGYDDLDEPVVAEREIEERGGADSGEGQEGESAARGRNRRRRRPTRS